MSSYFSFGSGRVVIGNGSVVVMGGGSEKSHWGAETVPSISSGGSAHLNGTTVAGSTNAGGSIHATGATTQMVNAGGSVHFTNSTCNGGLNAGGSATITGSSVVTASAGGSVTISDSKFIGDVSAGGSLSATRCSRLESLSAGGSATVTDCLAVRSIEAGCVTLNNSKVSGDVNSGGSPAICNSEIKGTLSCSAERLVIEHSAIDTIRISPGMPSAAAFSSRGGVRISGMTIRSGGSGVASGILIDGRDLLSIMADAARAEEVRSGVGGSGSSRELPKISLVLKDGCIVRNIIFEGAQGEVTPEGGSVVTGSVTNGAVKPRNE